MKTKPSDAERLFELGERIASLRKKQGMTQLSFALKAHISKSFLSDLERGARNPSYLTLCHVADALEVNVKDLFEDQTDD